VSHVDEVAVIGTKRDPDIKFLRAVRTDTQPVASAGRLSPLVSTCKCPPVYMNYYPFPVGVAPNSCISPMLRSFRTTAQFLALPCRARLCDVHFASEKWGGVVAAE